jgi:uridine phosphorylase
MAQEDEPELRGERERVRVPVDRLLVDFAAGLRAVDDFAAAGFLAAVERVLDAFAAVDLAAVERRAAGFFAAVDREPVDRARLATGVAAVVPDDAGFAPGRSSAPTRRARFSISVRSPLSSSGTPRSSSDSRTRVTARATSSTISLPRSLEPSGSARSTAVRTASTVSAAPEPFLSFFFLSFLGMGASLISCAVPGPVHLRPHENVAERVLLPGDPGRALRLAQQLLDAPKMLNHHRGLWGYTGAAADGAPLTIQSTGLGGPSAAIVTEELVALGARRLVRVGSCSALADLPLGSLVIAEAIHARDGASRALGADEELPADPALLAALRAAGHGAVAGVVVSTDLYYDPARGADEAVALDLTAGAVFAVAARHGVAAAAVFAVSDRLATGERIEPAALEAAEVELGRVGAAALA